MRVINKDYEWQLPKSAQFVRVETIEGTNITVRIYSNPSKTVFYSVLSRRIF